MERIVNLHIERLPEGMYLATSDDVQGLIAQGCTIQETIEIVRYAGQEAGRGAGRARRPGHPAAGGGGLRLSADRQRLMGRLAGFRYREISSKRLKRLGFEFDRQAAGSHEIWFNPETGRYTTIPNHPGDMPEGTLRAIPQAGGAF